MSENSRIYWFSGTGNSLYAAKGLTKELGGAQLEQITDKPPSGIVGGKGEKIGFVFPSYCLNLPRAVRAFVEQLEIKPDTYIFTVVTMGGPGHGSIASLNKALKAKGHRLNYGRGLRMPSNYVMLYNPAESSKADKMKAKVDARICTLAADIKSEMQSVKSLPFIMQTLYKNIPSLDVKFSAGDSCTGCAMCKKLCPVKNIEMKDSKPKWLHHCEHCVACISWCPTRAIEYGNKTQSRRRYQNPHIKAEELFRQEGK